MIMDNKQIFKNAMAKLATGVCVVTNTAQKTGITISSFASLSLKPAMVLFCVGSASSNRGNYNQGNSVVINGLAAQATAISNYFASSHQDDYESKVVQMHNNSTFILRGEVTHTTVAGDHDVNIVTLSDIEVFDHNEPLLYGMRNYGTFLAQE